MVRPHLLASIVSVLWEVLATPDIRLQAELLARHLLDDVADMQGRTAWSFSENSEPSRRQWAWGHYRNGA